MPNYSTVFNTYPFKVGLHLVAWLSNWIAKKKPALVRDQVREPGVNHFQKRWFILVLRIWKTKTP